MKRRNWLITGLLGMITLGVLYRQYQREVNHDEYDVPSRWKTSNDHTTVR